MTSAITLEQHARVRAAFEAMLDASVSPTRTGQLELFSDEEEQYLRQEVARLLWEPKLPNAGPQERKWLKQLHELSRDEALVVDLKLAAHRYAAALEKCLPQQEYIRSLRPGPDGKRDRWQTLPGCYYTRKAVTAKTNKGLWDAAQELLREARAKKDTRKKWFAQFVLDGLPVPMSNFKMECLYLLRGADGNVTRLVRLTNTKGEMSEGREIGGADVLPNEMYAGSEKFRQWVQSKGNFTWGGEGGAGNTELQLLQWDVTEQAAYRVVKLIEYCGWHALRAGHRGDAAGAAEEENTEPGKLFLKGLWIYDECAIEPDGHFMLPDEDGIYWYEGEGYALSRKGRELDFIQGRPRMRPPTEDGRGLKLEQVEFDTADWEESAQCMYAGGNQIGGFFREVCRRFYDTAGGHEGWLAVASILGYAAAPELFAKQNNFPSCWTSGQMGSGKSTFVSWLMSLCGFHVASGMGLISKNVSAVGIACQLENYSNLPLWLDEFRQHQIPADKEPLLRDSYNRQLAGKWTPDGIQRSIRTMPLVSGESTSGDAAMRSRYPHVMISEQKRLANHFEWMQQHQEFFFFIWREIMVRRREFVELVVKQVDHWLASPDLAKVPSRDRVSHSVVFAAFGAAAALFGSHDQEELAGYRTFLVNHALASAADVQADVNVNVFIQELITAYVAGEIPDTCFRVEKEVLDHAPGAPNQTAGSWESWKLFIEPTAAISHLQIYLRKGGQQVTLRYKDLRDQLSKNAFWIWAKNPDDGLKKRFGAKGSQVSKTAWGIKVDLHPLGYRLTPDEDWKAAQKDAFERGEEFAIGPVYTDGDPRKGPLFAIIEGVLKYESSKD